MVIRRTLVPELALLAWAAAKVTRAFGRCHVLAVPTLCRIRWSNECFRRDGSDWNGCNSVAPRCVGTPSCSLETRNVVSQAALLVEYPTAGAARACLRGMRHARGRAQGLVLDPTRTLGDGATQG